MKNELKKIAIFLKFSLSKWSLIVIKKTVKKGYFN